MNQENNNFNNGLGNPQQINNNIQANPQPINNGFVQQPNQNVNPQSQQMNQVNTSAQTMVQPQNINPGTYKLILTRPKNFIGSLVKFKIFVDDKMVGKIKNGETITLDVQPGVHTISFNKSMNQSINLISDMYADVVVLAGNKFGLTNLRSNNSVIPQNNALNIENANSIIKSAKYPLIMSCIFIALTFILLFTCKKVISPWMYGVSIGYTIINISSVTKQKQFLNEKYKSLIALNIISIVISVIGMAISCYLIIG